MSIDFSPAPASSPELNDLEWSQFESSYYGPEQTETVTTPQRERVAHHIASRAYPGQPSYTSTFGNVTLTQPGRVPGASLKK